MDGVGRRYNVGEAQALPREVVFRIFNKLFESINTFSTNYEDKLAGARLDYGD